MSPWSQQMVIGSNRSFTLAETNSVDLYLHASGIDVAHDCTDRGQDFVRLRVTGAETS